MKVGKNGKKKIFKPIQRKAAEWLANPDNTGTVTAMLKELNIPHSNFYRWLEDPDYIEYINSLIDKYTDSELPRVWKSLIKQCEAGSVPAIKLFFELKGKYKQEVNVSGGVVILSGGDKIED